MSPEAGNKTAYCSSCGAATNGRNFCTECGARICRTCGFAAPDGKFCTHCGEPLPPVQHAEKEAAPEKAPPTKPPAEPASNPPDEPVGTPLPKPEKPVAAVGPPSSRAPGRKKLLIASGATILALAVGVGLAVAIRSGGKATNGQSRGQGSSSTPSSQAESIDQLPDLTTGAGACDTRPFDSASGTRYIKIDVYGKASCEEAWHVVDDVLVRGDLDWRLQGGGDLLCGPPGPTADDIGTCKTRDGSTQFTVIDITDITNSGYMD